MNVTLKFCMFFAPLSHINRKTQYENPVLEARRIKQVDIEQPPEGERSEVWVTSFNINNFFLFPLQSCVCVPILLVLLHNVKLVTEKTQCFNSLLFG